MKLLISILGLAYAICPYDLFPDFFVGIGWIDDLLILGLIWWFFYRGKGLSFKGYNEKTAGFFSRAGREEFSGGKGNNSGFGFKDKGSQKDPYTILGVRRDATPEEIRQAYRRLANQYHPDKVLHLGDEFRELAEIRFKEIQKAYQDLNVN